MNRKDEVETSTTNSVVICPVRSVYILREREREREREGERGGGRERDQRDALKR